MKRKAREFEDEIIVYHGTVLPLLPRRDRRGRTTTSTTSRSDLFLQNANRPDPEGPAGEMERGRAYFADFSSFFTFGLGWRRWDFWTAAAAWATVEKVSRSSLRGGQCCVCARIFPSLSTRRNANVTGLSPSPGMVTLASLPLALLTSADARSSFVAAATFCATSNRSNFR